MRSAISVSVSSSSRPNCERFTPRSSRRSWGVPVHPPNLPSPGSYLSPRRPPKTQTWKRQTENLYGRDANALLQRDVADVRAELGLDAPLRPAMLGDALRLAGYMSASLLAVGLPLAAVIALILRWT